MGKNSTSDIPVMAQEIVEAVARPARGSTEQNTRRPPNVSLPICLDFQQVIVSGPFGKVDRSDTQKVRAHVMRQHHQKRRKDSGKDLEDLENGNEPIREAAIYPVRRAVKRKVVAPRKTRREFGKVVQFQPQIPSPQTRSPLGAGRWDPFLQIPLTDLPKGYHELVNHCVTVFWPGSFGASHYLNFAKDMIPKFAKNPLCLWSTLFTAASHLEGLRGKSNTSGSKNVLMIEQMERKGSTIQAVNAAMKDATSSQSDDLILTILILASSETPDQLEPADWSPFDAPLRSMQWIDIRGKRVYFKAHVKAMQTIIQNRGGLRNVKTFGVPCVISSLELTWCAASLSPPTHPLLDPLGRDIEYTPFVIDGVPLPLATPHLDPDLASGFSHLAEMHLYPHFRTVLLRLQEYSSVVELHVNGATLPDNMLENRNWVFHNLLRIPVASSLLPPHGFGVEKSAFDKIKCVYEICRLGAIMYSIHVIYPTPRSRSARERLLPLLKALITTIDPLTYDRPSMELALWCVTIGGIAATRLQDERAWFAAEFKKLCLVLGLTAWAEVKVVMRRFAWVESACDPGGEALWEETLALV